MSDLKIKFHFYALNKSTNPVCFASEVPGQSSTGLKTMFDFLEDIKVLFYDRGVKWEIKEWNFPNNCSIKFDNDITIDCTYDSEPDPFKKDDIERTLLGDCCRGWLVSRIEVSKLQFDNSIDALNYIRCYLINYSKPVVKNTNTDFSWDWKTAFKVS